MPGKTVEDILYGPTGPRSPHSSDPIERARRLGPANRAVLRTVWSIMSLNEQMDKAAIAEFSDIKNSLEVMIDGPKFSEEQIITALGKIEALGLISETVRQSDHLFGSETSVSTWTLTASGAELAPIVLEMHVWPDQFGI